jgi:hypothetical protein
MSTWLHFTVHCYTYTHTHTLSLSLSLSFPISLSLSLCRCLLPVPTSRVTLPVGSRRILGLRTDWFIINLSGESNWGATWKKSSGSCLENREYGRRDPSRWPRGTLYPQKLAIASPTSGGRSIGIVRSRTQTMEFSFLVFRDLQVAVSNIFLESRPSSENKN